MAYFPLDYFAKECLGKGVDINNPSTVVKLMGFVRSVPVRGTSNTLLKDLHPARRFSPIQMSPFDFTLQEQPEIYDESSQPSAQMKP